MTQLNHNLSKSAWEPFTVDWINLSFFEMNHDNTDNTVLNDTNPCLTHVFLLVSSRNPLYKLMKRNIIISLLIFLASHLCMLFSATVWPRSWRKQLQHEGDDGFDVSWGIREVLDRSVCFKLGIVWDRIGKSYEHSSITSGYTAYTIYFKLTTSFSGVLSEFSLVTGWIRRKFHVLKSLFFTCWLVRYISKPVWNNMVNLEMRGNHRWRKTNPWSLVDICLGLHVFIGIFTGFLCLSGWWKMIQIPQRNKQD